MELGVALPQFGPVARGPGAGDRIRQIAMAAERLGFGVVWTAEHLVFPHQIRTPYPYGGRFPYEVTDPIFDVATTLAHVAACTERIRLGSAVVVLPYHHPLALAKAMTTVDVLSEGRLLLGVASGWLREEFELLGVPFGERGARTDESLALLRALWTEDRVTFRGRFFQLDDAAFFPKPLQRPHPPIWIGGDSPAALRRVARFGDGWLAVPRTLDQLGDRIATLRREAERAGRDPARLGIASSGGARSLDELIEILPRLQQLGVTIVNLPAVFWTRTIADAIALMEAFTRRARIS